jgi:hypothetical protein
MGTLTRSQAGRSRHASTSGVGGDERMLLVLSLCHTITTRSAVEWAMLSFDLEFPALDAIVGGLEDRDRTTLSLVLEPTRAPARRTIERRGAYVTAAYNGDIQEPSLDDADFVRFLDFLQSREFSAWFVELAQWWDSQDGGVPDLRADRRFLHVRSLALLNEHLFGLLAEEFGTDADRGRVEKGSTKDPLKVFLVGRQDWRAELWQYVAEHYALTDTSMRAAEVAAAWEALSPVQRLESRLGAIDGLSPPARFAGAARHVLRFAAFRNFGAHRFTREQQFLEDQSPRIVGSVLFTALFYWKVATTLG